MIDKVLGFEPVKRRRNADNTSETYIHHYEDHQNLILIRLLQQFLLGLIWGNSILKKVYLERKKKFKKLKHLFWHNRNLAHNLLGLQLLNLSLKVKVKKKLPLQPWKIWSLLNMLKQRMKWEAVLNTS